MAINHLFFSRLITLIFILLAGAFSVYGQLSQKKIKRTIAKIEAFESAHVGISVIELSSKKKKVSYQEDKYMTPASNTKLLTFLAAITSFDSLPAIAYTEQNLNKKTVTHFTSTGYPLLLHPFYPDEKLMHFFKNADSLVYHIPKHNIKHYGEGWAWDDYPYYFAAETSLFPIYGNVVRATRDTVHQKTKTLPSLFPITKGLQHQKRFFARKELENHFLEKPIIWNKPDTLYVPFKVSDRLFSTLLGNALNKEIPTILLNNTSKITFEKKLYTQNESKLYKALLQESDNLIAESLLLMVSKKLTNEYDKKKGINVLKKQWSSFLPSDIAWVDGSGISRYNMITPESLVKILQRIYEVLSFPEIKNLFATGGVSGTIKNNYKGSSGQPFVFAKTGTLRHNHNLSGYFIGKKGKVYAFSIMINHYTATNQEIRKGIEELLQLFHTKL